MAAQVHWVDTAGSTNSLVAEAAAGGAPHGLVIAARAQSAGRGQRGNSWESEPGRNLTFSCLIRPERFDATRQFELSMLTAVSVRDSLARLLPDSLAPRLRVKWPNDIYFDDLKICGILIECQLTGRELQSAIAGIGININQLRFVSDAPNPVSLAQIIGRETALEPLLDDIVSELVTATDDYLAAPDPNHLLDKYRSRMWRREGLYHWRDKLTGEVIEASIIDVAANGPITLRLADGTERTYAFKEIAAIIDGRDNKFERF